MGSALNIALRPTRAEVDAELGADHHEGIAYIALLLAEIGQLEATRVAEFLAHRKDVRQSLGRVILIGETIPHGNAGFIGKLLNNGLVRAAILDTVVHATKHAGGILNGLLFAHLRRTGIKVGYT